MQCKNRWFVNRNLGIEAFDRIVIPYGDKCNVISRVVVFVWDRLPPSIHGRGQILRRRTHFNDVESEQNKVQTLYVGTHYFEPLDVENIEKTLGGELKNVSLWFYYCSNRLFFFAIRDDIVAKITITVFTIFRYNVFFGKQLFPIIFVFQFINYCTPTVERWH